MAESHAHAHTAGNGAGAADDCDRLAQAVEAFVLSGAGVVRERVGGAHG